MKLSHWLHLQSEQTRIASICRRGCLVVAIYREIRNIRRPGMMFRFENVTQQHEAEIELLVIKKIYANVLYKLST
jgi:hypothetical protein